MGEDPTPGVSLLLAVMAAQFLVHAAGWGMTAAMQRNASGPEAHFAAAWAALALALTLQFAAAMPLVLQTAAVDVLLIAAAVLVHRGLMRFYRQDAPERLYIGALAVALLLPTSLALEGGARVHAVLVALMNAAACVAIGLAFWRNLRRRTRWSTGTAALATFAAAAALLIGAGRDLLAPTPPARGVDTGLAIVLFFGAGLFNLAQVQLVIGRVLQHLSAQARLDPLTEVANRRGFMAALDAAHRRAQRSGDSYALLMVDIDHFKRINDERGHAAGDVALRDLAQLLAAGVRAGDTVGRFGGEEFCVLLPGIDLPGAEGLARRLCAAAAQSQMLTVSIGVALVQAPVETAEQALARADMALYSAKRDGRNRVVVA